MRIRDEQKEQAIRRNAIEMIVEEGFDGLSMQKLAKAAGVSPATIYIYFEDRDDLIKQITIEEGKKMSEAMLKDFDPRMSFAEGLRKQWHNRAEYCMNNPLSMQFIELIRFSHLHDKHYKMEPRFLTSMHGFVHNAIKNKELISLPLEIFWSVAYAPLYQLLKFHMAARSMPGREKFILDKKAMNKAFELVLKALTPQK